MSMFRRMLFQKDPWSEFEATFRIEAGSNRDWNSIGLFYHTSLMFYILPEVDNQEFEIVVTDNRTNEVIYSGKSTYKCRTDEDINSLDIEWANDVTGATWTLFETENKFELVLYIDPAFALNDDTYTAIHLIEDFDSFSTPLYLNVKIKTDYSYSLMCRKNLGSSGKNTYRATSNQLYQIIHRPKDVSVDIDLDLWSSYSIREEE